MELLHSFLHIFSSEGLRQLIQTGGLVAICLIIFAETGFFALLPGDSLLVLCGIFAATPDPITGQPRKEWPRGQGKTTVGGRLPFPMYLCDWCCKIVARTAEVLGTGRVPTEAELHRHHDEGKPVHIAVDPQAISASRTSTAAP
jgi:hypothetical protein